MPARLSKLATQRPRAVLLTGLALFLVGGAVGGTVYPMLTTGLDDYDAPDAPGVQARADIQAATGIDYQQGHLLLVRTDQRLDPAAPPPPLVTEAVQLLRARPEVRNVIDYYNYQLPALISADGTDTYLVAEVGELDERATADALRQAVADHPQLRDQVTVGGATTGNVQIAEVSGMDLFRAEVLALPLLLILLFLLFRGLVAALLPLLGATVVTTMALLGMRVVAEFVDLSVFSLNLLFALGLALSIDFSLLMVYRYREQLAATGDPAEAVARIMPRTGRVVLFSGLTIGIALLALTIFPQRFLYSMGVAGVLVTVFATLFALVLLPALLRLLGHRVNALAPRRLRYREPADVRAGWWYRFAQRVMRRPVAYALGAALFLVLVGTPFFGIRYAGVDPGVLPRDYSAGEVTQVIRSEFPAGVATPVRVAAYAGRGEQAVVTAYAQSLARLPGVADVAPPEQLSDQLWQVDVYLTDDQLSPAAQRTVSRLAEVDAPVPVRMTGLAADFVQRQEALGDRLPVALVLITVTTFLLLFAFTRSVVIPIKQLVVNFLVVFASVGLLVFIFQPGRLTGPLGYTSQGAVETTTLIILGCIVFGLSTDYGVFLYGRIKEAHDAGHPAREAVALGLARTGRIVTSAAALVCVAIGALMTAMLVSIKSLGVGVAFGVLVDATLARAVLLPALMALLGEYNWWAPGWLRRLHTRLRLDRIHEPVDRELAPEVRTGPS
jgi:RND superfamily putative drug exporter